MFRDRTPRLNHSSAPSPGSAHRGIRPPVRADDGVYGGRSPIRMYLPIDGPAPRSSRTSAGLSVDEGLAVTRDDRLAAEHVALDTEADVWSSTVRAHMTVAGSSSRWRTCASLPMKSASLTLPPPSRHRQPCSHPQARHRRRDSTSRVAPSFRTRRSRPARSHAARPPRRRRPTTGHPARMARTAPSQDRRRRRSGTPKRSNGPTSIGRHRANRNPSCEMSSLVTPPRMSRARGPHRPRVVRELVRSVTWALPSAGM